MSSVRGVAARTREGLLISRGEWEGLSVSSCTSELVLDASCIGEWVGLCSASGDSTRECIERERCSIWAELASHSSLLP